MNDSLHLDGELWSMIEEEENTSYKYLQKQRMESSNDCKDPHQYKFHLFSKWETALRISPFQVSVVVCPNDNNLSLLFQNRRALCSELAVHTIHKTFSFCLAWRGLDYSILQMAWILCNGEIRFSWKGGGKSCFLFLNIEDLGKFGKSTCQKSVGIDQFDIVFNLCWNSFIST